MIIDQPWLKEDVRKHFKGKKVIFLGDSIMRNIYQDFLYLIEKGNLTPYELLRKKGRQIPSFEGDYLLEGTGELTTGRTYREIREYLGSGGPLKTSCSPPSASSPGASVGSWRSSSTDSKGGTVTHISFSVLSGISTGGGLRVSLTTSRTAESS